MDESLPDNVRKELMAMDAIIGKTERKLEMLSADPYTRDLAEARERALRDWHSSMAGSREEGKAEGILIGKLDIVRKLLQNGLDPAFVAATTGLSLQELDRLQSEREPK